MLTSRVRTVKKLWVVRLALRLTASVVVHVTSSRAVAGAGRTWRAAIWRQRLRRLGDDTNILSNVVIHLPAGVSIGARVSIAEFVHIWGGGGVTIGDDTLIASHVVITSQTHNADAEVFRETQVASPVSIGSNCWIGSGAIILPGVSIGDGCIVAAGAVVRESLPALSVAAGVPARVVRTRDKSRTSAGA